MDWPQECQRLQKENAALKAEIAQLHRQLAAADMASEMDIYAEATKDLKRAELINFDDFFKAQTAAQTGSA